MILCSILLVAAAGVAFTAVKSSLTEPNIQALKETKTHQIVIANRKKAAESSESSGLPRASESSGRSLLKFGNAAREVKNTATKANHKTDGLAICMFHYVYCKDHVPKNLNNNYIEQGALKRELRYLVRNKYYFPSWKEVREYVDGDLLLPKKSVVLTFDDGAKSFLKYGLPVIEEMKVPVTSFLITGKNGKEKVKKYSNAYVSWQSHSDNMHRPGGHIGHGGIFTALSAKTALADLKKSVAICGNGDAFAYPFGDYNAKCVKEVKKTGFLCAVTTKYGRVYPGDNPYLLSRVRMLGGQSLRSFVAAVR